MLNLMRVRQYMATHCCSIRHRLLSAVFCVLFVLLIVLPAWAQKTIKTPDFPIAMDELLSALGDAHCSEPANVSYPRVLHYNNQCWNMLDDSLSSEQVTISVEHQPQRIIPHTVGLTEVLWAIVPHKRIIAAHKSCFNPSYSFLAGRLPDALPTYDSEDAEIVIGFSPDLVLTTYYSSAAFKKRLTLSRIPFVEMGFFGDITSIEKQIRFVGELVGAEASAHQLLASMEHSVTTIKCVFKQRMAGRTLRVLYYDRMGFVAGKNSTFDSLCSTLGIENVATRNGIKFFKQIDYETVLKWNPDIIIVPQNSGLDRSLLEQPILATAKAVLNKNIRTMPGVYLMASSQFAVASLNYLGGILYAK